MSQPSVQGRIYRVSGKGLYTSTFRHTLYRVLNRNLRQHSKALFSLSLGMGTMITYGSYLSKKENLPLASVTVAFFDTMIAILAGLIIFPAVFSAGMEPAQSVGLVFVGMPTVLLSNLTVGDIND